MTHVSPAYDKQRLVPYVDATGQEWLIPFTQADWVGYWRGVDEEASRILNGMEQGE